MNKQSYQELLKDPRWIKRRNEILTRDKNTCQFCGAQDKYLHVHHKYYIDGKKPWEYEDDGLVAICEKCHDCVTRDKEDLYPLFIQVRDLFRSHGFSDSVFFDILCRFSNYLEFFDTEMSTNDDLVRSVINKAVCATQNYDDLKALAKFGIKHPNFI